MQALLLQVVGQLLDSRLVLHGRVRVVGAEGALERVLAVPAMDPVEVLGLRVVRLQIPVVDRPGGRDPVVVLELAEVLGTQPEQGSAVELRVAADVVVHLGLERVVVPVVPGLGGQVLAPNEDRAGVPVVALAREVPAAFEEQHPLAGGSQAVRDGSAAGSAADDDDVVVVVAHVLSPSSCRRRSGKRSG